jgi:hypothetical protein
MVSEEVTIEPVLGPWIMGDGVRYDCRFVLKNISSTDAALQVGFPIDAEIPVEPTGDESDKVMACHFIARDKRQTYHVRYVRSEPPARYRELLVWDMHFTPGEEKVLRVSYDLPMSTALASSVRPEHRPSNGSVPTYGRSWFGKLDSCLCEWLTYTTDTGNSWAGSIEKATFRIHTAGLAYWMNRRSDYILAGVDCCIDVGLTHLEQSPGDWNYDAESGFMTWKVRDYKPGEPIRFIWYGTALPAEADECETIVRQLLGEHPPEAEVLELSEIVAAFYGIAPQTVAVKEFVERQVWYHPKQGLKRSELSEEQQEVLARLEAIAKEGLKAAQAEKPFPTRIGAQTDSSPTEN